MALVDRASLPEMQAEYAFWSFCVHVMVPLESFGGGGWNRGDFNNHGRSLSLMLASVVSSRVQTWQVKGRSDLPGPALIIMGRQLSSSSWKLLASGFEQLKKTATACYSSPMSRH